MNDNDSYFKKALSDFAFDAAYGDSIRHLYRKGYSPETIKEHLDAKSLSVEMIKHVIDRIESSVIREDSDSDHKGVCENSSDRSDGSKNNSYRIEYVKEYDAYGRASFIRRKFPIDT